MGIRLSTAAGSIANATDCTNLDTVKMELQISSTKTTDDEFIEQLINEASDFIDTWCGRTMAKQTYVETMDSKGGLTLLVKHTPLTSIIVITDDGSSFSSTKYEIDDEEAGIIFAEGGFRSTQLRYQYIESFPTHEGKRTWSIEYSGGYEMPGSTATRTLPYDLERACIDIVKTGYLRRGEDTRIRHQSVDETFEILVKEALTPSALRVLERYRRVVVQ